MDNRPSDDLDRAPTSAPRMAPNADRPGEYRLAIRILDAEIDPGDELRLEIYIVGYGKIRGSKVSFRPPLYFIDPKESKVVFGARGAGGQLLWGRTEERMNPEGFTLLMKGLRKEGWEDSTPYFDVLPPEQADKDALGIAIIAAEKKYGAAPIGITLKVQDEAPTGTHNLQFFFTYFNGNEWKSDIQSVDVLVRTWVRRHELITVVGGVLVALVALLATILSLVFDVLSYIAA